MITIYECEICGYQSISAKDVRKCEAQGRNPLFAERQRAVLGYGSAMEPRPTIEVGRVISYQKETHLPVYALNIPPEYPELQRTIFSAPQDWLQRPAPSAR